MKQRKPNALNNDNDIADMQRCQIDSTECKNGQVYSSIYPLFPGASHVTGKM